MSRKDSLIKSKSIYTLRSKHTIIPDGTIFENDHVTIIRDDGIYNEDIPLFSESNFKFRIGAENRGKKKHSRGGFVNVDESDDSVWTLLNLPEHKKATDSNVVLKPNYNSIKDFAYYGSAVELLKATVRDIVMRYPGGLYYYPEDKAPSITLGGQTYYLVSNEFNIDFWTPIGCSTEGIDNPLRVLGASYMNYVDGNGNQIALNACITGDCLDSVIGRVSFKNLNTQYQASQTREVLGYRKSEESEMVLSDGNDRSDSLVVNNESSSILYYLRITATTNNNGIITPIQNGLINFIGTTNKNDTLTTKVSTDENGVAVAQVPSNGNGSWVGNGNIYDISEWGAYYVRESDETYYYNSHGIRYIFNGDTADTITIVESEPLIVFPLTVYVSTCDTKTPIEGASVAFYIATNTNEGIQVFTAITNEEGFCYFNEDDFTPEIQVLFKEFPTVWYAIVTYNEEVEYTQRISVRLGGFGSCCFWGENNNPPFLACTVVGVLDDNGNIGEGNNAKIDFFDSNGNRYTVWGITDENGSFMVDCDRFYEVWQDHNIIPARAYGEITYNDETKQSSVVTIFNSVNNPQNYTLTVYFTEEPPLDVKTLQCTVAFEGEIGLPVEDVSVIFRTTAETSNNVYTASSRSNQSGLAFVDIPSGEWRGGSRDNILEDLADANKWSVSCSYNGNPYRGKLGTLSIKGGQYANRIEVREELKWDRIIIMANNGSSPSVGAVCTVCASTKDCGLFSYYINGITDENGRLIIENDFSDWNHFPRTPIAASSNEFVYWQASAMYHGKSEIMPTCHTMTELSYTFIFTEDPTSPPYSYSCGGMDDSNSFLIYMNGDGKKLLLTTKNGPDDENSVIIEPKKGIIDSFWESLDDFESVLLNRSSKPIYKSILETPYVENGVHYYDYRQYVWPTVNGYAPDTSSGVFHGYLSNLMSIAEYYDEYDSDNLWRMMTHESIKNLDNSGIVYMGTDSVDLTRMEAMLRIHGRLYDDIKRYADGIKSINVITYDEKNNLPDYFLSDNIDICGLESKSISTFPQYDDNMEPMVSDNVFSGAMTSGITSLEINGEFMKRLSLSEDYILTTKGTRRGIEYILGMFGYRYISGGTDYEGNVICIGDYKITEYIRVAHNFPNYNDLSALRLLGNYSHSDAEYENLMEGYPLAVVSNLDSDGEADYYTIPWVNNGDYYVNNIYFQEKGGWGRIHKKNINLDITTASEIEEASGFTLYGETAPYMSYVSNIEELTSMSNNVIYEGMICYVTDISGLYSTYSAESDYNNIVVGGEEQQQQQQQNNNNDSRTSTPQIPDDYQANVYKDYSHYFVLVNPALSTHIGFVKNSVYSCYGWRNILSREFKNGPTTYDGLKLLYLESLELDSKGNNPHCGFGNYDDGHEYIEKLNRLFGSSIDVGDFDTIKDDPKYQDEFNEICTVGFDVRGLIEDNDKCYYFNNDNSEIIDRAASQTTPTLTSVSLNGNTCELVQIIVQGESEDTIEPEKYEKFVNPESENGSKTDECAAFSVVNVKNLKITFYTGGNKYFEEFLNNIVFKYLLEMVPSTTILEFEFLENCGITSIPEVVVYDYYYDNGLVENTIVGDSVSVSVDDGTIYIVENNQGIIE